MLESKKFKILLGLGAILVPTVVFGKTSATVQVDVLQAKVDLNDTNKIETTFNKGDEVEVLEIIQDQDKNKWYKIVTTDNQNVLVQEACLTITGTEGVANANKLNVRSYPDTKQSQVLTQLNVGDEVRLIYKVNGFYKAHINGQSGFIYAEYIDSMFGDLLPEQSIENVRDTITGESKVQQIATASKGEAIVEEAMKYLGTPYVYGGTSLTSGVDCSGFTQGVMRNMGISIPRTSQSQSQTGTLVSKNQLQKGDLLFFGNSVSSIYHVGIYIGDGKMIHSGTAATGGVIIDSIYTGAGAPLQVARRVI